MCMSKFRVRVLLKDNTSYIFENKVYDDIKEARENYNKVIAFYNYNGTENLKDIILEEKIEKE